MTAVSGLTHLWHTAEPGSRHGLPGPHHHPARVRHHQPHQHLQGNRSQVLSLQSNKVRKHVSRIYWVIFYRSAWAQDSGQYQSISLTGPRGGQPVDAIGEKIDSLTQQLVQTLSREVLPQPEGPRRQETWPGGSERLTLSRTVVSSYCSTTCRAAQCRINETSEADFRIAVPCPV